MYIYIYKYIHIYIYIYVCVSLSLFLSLSLYTYIYIYIYIYTCVNIYIYICIHVYIYIYIYIYGRFPKLHRVFLGRDPGTFKSDIVSTKISTTNLFGFETLKFKIRNSKIETMETDRIYIRGAP